MDVPLQWMQTPEAKKIPKDARAKAWASFLAKYKKADESKFVAEVDFANHTATAEIMFKAGPDYLKSVSAQIANTGLKQ